MHAAPVHHAFSIEQFEVRSYENSVFFQGFAADCFAVLGVDLDAINVVVLEDFAKFLEISVNDESVCLPHWSSQLIIDDQLKVVRNSWSTKAISIGLVVFLVSTLIKVLFLSTFSWLHVNSLFFSLARFLFFVGFEITVVISRYHDFRVVQSFDVFVEGWHIILFRSFN